MQSGCFHSVSPFPLADSLSLALSQFGGQEPGSHEQIKDFVAKLNPPVTFTLFSKCDVNGSNVHPVFVFLKQHLPGVLGTTFIKWNFTKVNTPVVLSVSANGGSSAMQFLVSRDGIPVKRYGTPEQPRDMEEDIKQLLAQPVQNK